MVLGLLKKFLPVLCLALLTACAARPPLRVGAVVPSATQVSIDRDGDGWTAHFHFAVDAPIWAFARSAVLQADETPWRPKSWDVVTPGVSLTRIGDFDAFVAGDGKVPRDVTIRFRPLGDVLITGYDPAIILSDGTLALYGGQFDAFPAQSREAVEALPEPEDYPARISLAAGGTPLIFAGRRMMRVDDVGDNYVYVGDAALVPDDPVATILDPGLPVWISTNLRAFTPSVFSAFEASMGPHKGSRPMVIASWAGTDDPGASMSGSVSSGLITMRLEGARLRDETPGVLQHVRWFIAHEAAHFWLGETVGPAARDDAWIMEGGADFLAMQATLRADPGYDASKFMAEARADCATALAKGPLAAARRRNDPRADYACGALFAQVVETAGKPRGEGFADFVRILIETDADRQVTPAEWLAAARAFGVSAEQAERIEALIAGDPNAAPIIDALLGD